MIRLVTDSSSDLPPDLVAKHKISVVPLTVKFGERVYTDGNSLSTEQFWQLFGNTSKNPEISAPGMGLFTDTYHHLENEGATGLVVVCLSSAMSATFQSAQIAAETYTGKIPITVIDSRAVSMGLGLAVLAGTKAAGRGLSLEEVSAAILDAVTKVNLWVATDTLEYLLGGKMAHLDAWLGRLLSIKTLLHLSDGMMTPAKRAWTSWGAQRSLLSKVEEVGPRLRHLSLIGSRNTNLHSMGERLSSRLAASRDHKEEDRELITTTFGAVVGSYCGPGILGVAYLLD